MASSQEPDSITYQQDIFKAGLHSGRPPFTFQPAKWESMAKEVLPATAWGYLHGNAGMGSTYDRNLAAFRRWSIVPRRMRPSRVDEKGNPLFSDTTATVLGKKLPFPLALAPIGVQKIFNEVGELGAAKAASALRIPYILSSATSTSPEDVADAIGEAPRWFQLYWPAREHDDITISMLRRAKDSGYTVLFVTLDTYNLGWRPADLDNGYNPFLHPDRTGVEIGLSDPAFRQHFKEKSGYDIDDADAHKNGRSAKGPGLGPAAAEFSHILFPGHSHDWKDLDLLKKHWDGPIVLKGIQTVEDAQAAVAAGMQGIVVSNHGGRQQDGGCSSLGMLPHIVEAVGDELEIFFDSGVRCGADIMKALALGAKCVLIGRPYAYGLALGGEEGVKHVLRSLGGDLMMNMHLSGLRSVDEIKRDVLVKEDELF
jgi:lactate 2-monooxygenase